MRIAFFNSYDSGGGASRSALRLANQLNKDVELSVNMFVRFKQENNKNVYKLKEPIIVKALNFIASILDSYIFSKIVKNTKLFWSISILPRFYSKKQVFNEYDILHVHWLGNEFISSNMFYKFNKTIIWTFHDSAPFTGGCHIPLDCNKYTNGCKDCSQIKYSFLCRRMIKKKKRYWSDMKIVIVCPSKWLAHCAEKSEVFKKKPIFVIPNGIDCVQYKPIEKSIAKKVLNLVGTTKYILFGAINSTQDINKGFDILLDALSKVKLENTEIIVFGSNCSDLADHIPIKINFIGSLHDEISLSLLYSAANLFVCPSRSENLPNTILESMACGTPVVGFNIGGIPDIIDHKVNGYLATPFSSDDLAQGINWILEDENRYSQLSAKAREKVSNCFNIDTVAQKYKHLYKSYC